MPVEYWIVPAVSRPGAFHAMVPWLAWRWMWARAACQALGTKTHSRGRFHFLSMSGLSAVFKGGQGLTKCGMSP